MVAAAAADRKLLSLSKMVGLLVCLRGFPAYPATDCDETGRFWLTDVFCCTRIAAAIVSNALM